MATLDSPLPLPHGSPLPHRIALAPLTNKQSHADGTLGDDELRWLAARAEGGMALTMTCAAFVAREGQAWEGQLGVHDDRCLPGLTRLATALRDAGAGRTAVQLHHGGRRGDPVLHGSDNLAPWADESARTRAMTVAEIDQAVALFADAARRAEQAGFDGVEVHGAHGYLVAQFMDARHNHRDDGYGGSPGARARFLREVLAAVREATGPDFCVGVRLSPERFGIPLADGVAAVEQVLASGVADYVDLSLWDVRAVPSSEPGDGRLLIDHLVDLPRHGTAIGVAGGILSAADARWCLDRGADFVLVGTGAIVHHDFARRALADPDFRADALPVTAERLREESVGEVFIDYLGDNWDTFVA